MVLLRILIGICIGILCVDCNFENSSVSSSNRDTEYVEIIKPTKYFDEIDRKLIDPLLIDEFLSPSFSLSFYIGWFEDYTYKKNVKSIFQYYCSGGGRFDNLDEPDLYKFGSKLYKMDLVEFTYDGRFSKVVHFLDEGETFQFYYENGNLAFVDSKVNKNDRDKKVIQRQRLIHDEFGNVLLAFQYKILDDTTYKLDLLKKFTYKWNENKVVVRIDAIYTWGKEGPVLQKEFKHFDWEGNLILEKSTSGIETRHSYLKSDSNYHLTESKTTWYADPNNSLVYRYKYDSSFRLMKYSYFERSKLTHLDKYKYQNDTLYYIKYYQNKYDKEPDIDTNENIGIKERKKTVYNAHEDIVFESKHTYKWDELVHTKFAFEYDSKGSWIKRTKKSSMPNQKEEDKSDYDEEDWAWENRKFDELRYRKIKYYSSKPKEKVCPPMDKEAEKFLNEILKQYGLK